MRLYLKCLLSALLCISACTALQPVKDAPAVHPEGPVEVGFYAGRSSGIEIQTRSNAGEDGLSTEWTEGDVLGLWAYADDGTAALEAQRFSTYGLSSPRAFFTSVLDAPMEEQDYTYFAVYPMPDAWSGTKVSFRVPSRQDGCSGGGADVMVAGPVRHGALEAVDWLSVDHEELNMSMEHLLHRLRFYTEAGTALNGESVQKIEVTFPRPVVGKLDMDLAEGVSGVEYTATGTVVTLVPDVPVPISSGGGRNYITASIIPTTFAPGETMSVKLYTETKLAKVIIPLQGRTFAAGHSTPVNIIPASVSNLCKVYVNVLSNNLGEGVDSITLAAPEGCRWQDDGNETFVYSDGSSIGGGHSFVLEFEDESAFRTLSGKAVQVTYDSKHAQTWESLTIPGLDGQFSAVLNLDVPYLLYEDFSGIGTFSYDDTYSSTFNSGSKSGHAFLSGWSGGRIGAQAGKCVRLASRREMDLGSLGDYAARLDSAPLIGRLKIPADLEVEFDYGADNKYGGISLITDPNLGQNCHIGYVTSSKTFESGDENGTFEADNTFYVKENTGSYDSTPNSWSFVLHSVPVSDVIRVTWRTEVEHQIGANNTTCWLYVDNIKVKIKE